MMHPTHDHSVKSSLMPPTPGEVAKLAQLSHTVILEAPSREKHAVPHRSLRQHLSPQAIDALVARYTAGEKTPVLSRAFGISESGCRDLLRAEGVSLCGHAMTPEDAEQAVLSQQWSRRSATRTARSGRYSWGTVLRSERAVKEVGWSKANGLRCAFITESAWWGDRSTDSSALFGRILCMDVILREDARLIHMGQDSQVTSALRDTAMHLVHIVGVTAIATTLQSLSRDSDQAIAYLTQPLTLRA